ncbi:Uncharacterized [Syntrophomonas zehnderi OL-4]|uniref:Uncharacterized n=1 Tax=Syntrophomonas zehnderi OL-4 TaxID=690567 RepID=A0A0E4C7R9_9FIRM|nr:hypothetical protein [Syntrophomonas zehnderi]CFX11685.1 Uncharacterized [Syntrophomonas zehnderi OL-4]
MKASEVFLLMLGEAGGTMRGKTLIQKKAYFLNVLLDLGLPYNPHYYGPYSPELDNSIGKCKALGLVEQNTVGFGVDGETGFEKKRFDYKLTADGEEVLRDLEKRKPEEYREIKDCLKKLSLAGDEDYVSLSIAAKTYHILKESDTDIRSDEVANEAKQLGWEISQSSIDKAVGFLSKMGMI